MTTRTKKFGNSAGDRLRLLRRELNLSREEIERRFALSAETLKAWENGKVGLTEKGLKRCMTIFAELGILVSREWVMDGVGIDPRLSRGIEDLFKSPEALNEGQLPDDLEFLLKEVEFFKASSSNASVLMVSNEEMLPYYKPGDYVGGRFRSGSAIESAVGKDCIIITATGDKLFRRLVNVPEQDVYKLVAHNPLWGRTLEPVIVMKAEELAKVAPVVWHRRAEA